MRRILFIGSFLLIAACSKDKVATKPSIKISRLSTGVVANGSDLTVELDFTDKEGDISNSIFIQKIRTNKRVVPTIRDSFSLPIAAYPGQSIGNILLHLNYQNHLIAAVNPPTTGNPPVFENDTLILKFVLRDLGGHTSDTVSTSTVVINRN
jgi:hypothetical protein